MRKILVATFLLLIPAAVFAKEKVETIEFGKAKISFNPQTFKPGEKRANGDSMMFTYVSPVTDKNGTQINSSFGIVLQKVPEDAEVIMGYVNQLIRFGVYEDHKIPQFTNDDDFMKIPNSCGTIFDLKYPDGTSHTVLFIASAYKGIAITIIADTTSDTFQSLIGKYKKVVKSFRVNYE